MIDILKYIDEMQVMYGDKDPSPMDQEPRTNYSNGLSVDPERDSFKKISNVLGAFRRYRRGEKNPKLNFNQFFELYSTENFAEGGRIGYADENAGKLVKKLIPLDKTKLDKANLKRVETANEILYEKYGKEVVDSHAKEWAKKSNLEKNRTRKITNTDLPLDEMENPNDRANFRRKFREDIAKGYGEFNPDRRGAQTKKRYPDSVTRTNKQGFKDLIFDTFGRAKIKGTDKPNPNQDLPKLKAMQKNLAEYKILKKYLDDNFKIVTALDHPLDKATIQAFMNASAKDLTNVNILEQNLNSGFKKTLNNRYREAVQMGGEKGLKQKRAIETIAKKFKLNIGSVPDNQFVTGQVGPNQINKINKGVGSFETLNIKDEMLKSLKNASKLDTKWGNYIKDNPDVFKDARIDIKRLIKPKNVENITKNLPEIEKYFKKQVTNLVGELACGVKSANGGRINFSNGSSCNVRGKKILDRIVATGKGTKAELSMAKKILNFGKGALSLKGLVGPQALAAEALLAAGFVGYDVAAGKPLKEAIGKNLNAILGPKWKQDVESLEFERLKGSGVDIDQLKQLSTAYKQADSLQSLYDRQYSLEQNKDNLDLESFEGVDMQSRENELKQINMTINELNKPGGFNVIENITKTLEDPNILRNKDRATDILSAQEANRSILPDFTTAPIFDTRYTDKKMGEMKELSPSYSDQEINELYTGYGRDPKELNYKYTPINFPGDTSSKPVTGRDDVRDFFKIDEQNQKIADAGGVANMASGGIMNLRKKYYD